MLAGIALIAVLTIYGSLVSSSMPRIKDGGLDLSGWSREEAFEVTGEWEFYWDRLLDAAQIKKGTEPFSLVEAPGEWNYYETDGDSLPGAGKATYHVRVSGAEDGKEYGIRIQNMASAYRLYVDDILIAQNGRFGDGTDAPVSDYRPQLPVFTPAGDSFDLVLQISNDAYAVGGMWEPVIFGTTAQVADFNKTLSSIGMFSFGCLVIMCLFFLIFFAVQRKEKDVLILSAIGTLMILRLMISGDVTIAALIPNMPIAGFGWIDYLTLVWVQFLLYYFVYSAYGGLVPRWQIIALLCYSTIVSLLVVILPFSIVSSAYVELNIILLLVIALVTAQLARAAWRGQAGAPALLGALVFVLLFIFYGMYITDRSLAYYLLSASAFDYLLLFCVQCVIVARRYRRAQKMEVALLKSQIRPHFIHNSLNTIISVSRKDGEKARELLLDFSSYLRGFYDYADNETVPLEQELELIRAYTSLEQARFGERLRVEYRIEVENLQLPPLILQPLVENAFVHGLRENEGGGTVLIYIERMKNGKVRLGVRDDGVGLGNGSRKTERQGIGIENINRRLSRIYRTQLTFSVPEGGGCEVCMEIPLREEPRHESLPN
jgi:hypothetical protein